LLALTAEELLNEICRNRPLQGVHGSLLKANFRYRWGRRPQSIRPIAYPSMDRETGEIRNDVAATLSLEVFTQETL